MNRVAGEQQKKEAALATARGELQSAQAEMARLVAEGDKKRAEGAALDSRLTAARAELARIEAETKQAAGAGADAGEDVARRRWARWRPEGCLADGEAGGGQQGARRALRR